MVWKVIAYDIKGDSSLWSEERSTIIKWAGPRGMKLIISGSFTDGKSCTVNISNNFWMDSTEVTQADYEFLMSNYYPSFSGNPSNFIGTKRPVESVPWYRAIMYCNARSKARGLDTVYSYDYIYSGGASNLSCHWDRIGYRLPTEDEWELAAHAGLQLEYPTDNGTINLSKANYDTTHTVNVASYLPNPFKLYDMAGNVSEWCWDFYSTEGRNNNRFDYSGPASGTNRVVRGGSWQDNSSYLMCVYRFNYYPSNEYNNIGIRVVLPER